MTSPIVSDLSPPQRLALAYAPASARTATLALLGLDARLAAILRQAREPVLAQMRLAWWRDLLAKPSGDWPGGDPVLSLLADWDKPQALGPLVDGWEQLLQENLTAGAIADYAQGRSAGFLALYQQMGGGPAADAVGRNGLLFALADLTANLGSEEERDLVLASALAKNAGGGSRSMPRSMRPLAVLAGLGRRSIARGGAPLLDGPRALALAVRLGILGR